VDQCDGWYGPGNTLAELEQFLPELQAMRAQSKRAQQPFSVIAPLTEALAPNVVARLEALGVTGTVSYPFLFGIGPGSTLDDKKRYMDDFAKRLIAA
jgi:hypothetical protein